MTQNQIIDITGKSIIQESIVEEVNKANLFSIMVDEITSFNNEYMCQCVFDLSILIMKSVKS